MKKPFLFFVFFALTFCCSSVRVAQAQNNAIDPNNAFYAIHLEGFFPADERIAVKRLNLYLVRRNGQWVSSLGTPTNDGRPVWNTAILPVGASKLLIQDGKLSGEVGVTLVPDPWVPLDQKVRAATVKIDGTLTPAGDGAQLGGAWQAAIAGEKAELEAARLQGQGNGKISGRVARYSEPYVADVSYDLALYNLIPGQTNENFQRRRALSLGVKNSAVVSARLGQMDMRHNAYDYVTQATPQNFAVTPDAISSTVTFSSDTLDGERAEFTLALQGQRVADFLTGSYKGTYTIDGGQPQPISGFFRGNVRKGAFVPTMAIDNRPWFVPAANWKPVAPGEHPRLFFRKDDVPELRRRAATPEGQIIIKRLRELLNGSDGETMPAIFNPATKAYENNKFKYQTGAYSISHGAGYGFLYQLTGDKKYADFTRQCLELAWKGQRNFDDRYSWVAPGGELRAGPSLAWYAVAYDLCYDAWPEDFRREVALKIQNYSDQQGGEWNNPEAITLRKMVLTPKQGPGSNHFGAVVGGSGLAVLAIKGDPGTDDELLNKYQQVLERQVGRHLSAGWGDGGYYQEGWGASRVGTQGSFLPFLQALKVAAGHDYLNGEWPNASFITMVPRSLMMLGPTAYFPYRSNMGGTYGNPEIGSPGQNDGFSHGGYFSEGFGAIADKYKPGLLWTYNHVFSPDNKYIFDTFSPYSHRAMLALVNWPTFAGITEKNPAEAMPLATRDSLYEYFVFRNGFRDANDIVTTVLINQPDGTRPREVMVWGLGGLRLNFGEPERKAKVMHYASAKDGSGSLAAGNFALAVDYSKASGADALILSLGSDVKPIAATEKAKLTTAQVAGKSVNILTLSVNGQHPQAKVNGDKLTIGGQVVKLSEGRLLLEKAVP